MKILWYADFAGDDKQLAEVDRIFSELTEAFGGSVDGPYFPQQESLLYIIDAPDYSWLNETGRRFLPRVQKAGIPITPVRYEVAVSPKEFWGED